MNSPQYQKGMTGLGWVMVFFLIAFFTLIILRLFPAYMDSFKVGSIVSDIREEQGIGSKTPAEIRTMIMRRFDINMVTDVGRDDIYIERRGGMLVIEVDYEVRRKMLGNIDVVISFNKSAEVIAN
jgi:hypothetical protein